MKAIKVIITVIIFVLCCVNARSQAWHTLYDSASAFINNEDYQSALPKAEQALAQAEKEFGKLDTNYANALGIIASIFYNIGNLDSALLYQEMCINTCRILYKGDNTNLANKINTLGVIHDVRGEYKEAESLYLEALAMYKRLFKIDNIDLANCLNNLAVFYDERSDYKHAELLYNEALSMYRRLFKTDNSTLANSINNLGYFYDERGEYDKAESLYVEALAMYRRLFKSDNLKLAISINNMAAFYDERGYFQKAEPLYIEALEMCRRLFKTDNFEYAAIINSVAFYYFKRGDYKKAEMLFIEALNMRKRLFKSDHPDLAQSLNNLALLYHILGNYKKAEPLYLEALRMYRRIYKTDNANLAQTINNMAAFYDERGEYNIAESLYIEALAMFRRLVKKDQPDLANCINNLAMFYNQTDDIKKAEPLYIEALKMRRNLFKTDNANLAMSINNLAVFYNKIGNYKKAELLFIEAVSMYRRLFKTGHPYLAQCLNDMATFYFNEGNNKVAETLLKESLTMYKNFFKVDHPNIAKDLSDLASFYEIINEASEAEHLYKEALQAYSKVLINYFPSLSEKEKILFWNTMSDYFERFNSFAIKRAKDNPKILEDIYDNQLSKKAMFLNSDIKIKERIMSSGDSALISIYKNWKYTREFLGKLYNMTNVELKKNNFSIDSVENVANNLEKEISLKSESFAKSYEKKNVNWETIQFKLKPGEAAVEIIRFRNYGKIKNRYNPKVTEPGFTDTVFYGALILRKNSYNPEFIMLENGNKLEGKYYKKYMYAMNPGDSIIHNFETYKNYINKLPIQLNDLYNEYWGKIQDKLSGIKKVYLSVDGVYNKINLNTLLTNNGKYLLNELDICLLSSTKDLLDKGDNSLYFVKKAVFFGNPDYDRNDSRQNIISYFPDKRNTFDTISPTRSKSGTYWKQLPETQIEVRNIAKDFIANGWNTEVFLGDSSDEGILKKIDSPTILHIATHGYFDKDVKKIDYTNPMINNPLLRSGLVFAGANDVVRLFEKHPDSDYLKYHDDGLLTAYEIMNMNLSHTDLVVLSACETGLGDIMNGEGVFGLQRAFLVAGAKNIVMSLWDVNDQATQKLMTLFYSHWLKTENAQESLKAAQNEMLKDPKYSLPCFWGGFVVLGKD